MLWVLAGRVSRYRRVVTAAVLGAVVSVGAELVQHLLLDERTTDARDVLANTLGALIGAAVTTIVLRSAARAGSTNRAQMTRAASEGPA